MDKIGKFIGVGSVKHGQGITSLVYSIGYTLANYTELKILIFDMNYLFGEMEYLIDRKTQNCIDDLISIVKNSELTPEILTEHTEVLKENLRLVNPSRIDNSNYLKENADDVLKIIEAAKKTFDLVIVDTTAGSQSPLSRLIYSNCDVFLNIMTQNPYILEWYKVYNHQKDIKEINVINMFEDDVYPGTSEIKKNFGVEHVTIPYSKHMRDYYNQKKISEFSKHKDKYNSSIRSLVKRILTVTNIEAPLKFENERQPQSKDKKGILNKLFGAKG